MMAEENKKRARVESEEDEDTPLERAVSYIRQVKDDPGCSAEHRTCLDRALAMLLHEGIERDEHREKRRALLRDLQANFDKYWTCAWEARQKTQPDELQALYPRFGELEMRDIGTCLLTIRKLMLLKKVEVDTVVLLNGACDRINFLLVHQYGEKPLAFSYFYRF